MKICRKYEIKQNMVKFICKICTEHKRTRSNEWQCKESPVSIERNQGLDAWILSEVVYGNSNYSCACKMQGLLNGVMTKTWTV